MKLKKFFAGVLAAAMMLTVGATAAFATEPDKISVPDNSDNSYKGAKMFTAADPNLELTKELHVASGTAPDTMEFDFTVKSGATTVATPSVTFNKADNTDGAAFTAGNTGNTYSRKFIINLNEILGDNKTQVGTYNYTITENDTTIPGITKDSKTVNMTVTVINKAEENLSATTGYGYIVALRNAGDKDKSDGTFTNTYNSYSLEVMKTVKGSLGDLNQNFTFTITLGKAAGKDNNYASATVSSDNATNDGTWTWTADGQAQKTVTLKHGQTATISNLPVGVTYTVTENGKGAEGWLYEVTGEAVATNDVLPSITDNNNNNKVNIINDHKGVPDMGVVLDNAPYIAMLAIVAIGGVALMLNKRRRDEE